MSGVRLLLPALLLAATLAFATGARSSEHSAAWTWDAAVPGDVAAQDAQLRELAATGDFRLYDAMRGGELVVGPAADQLQPLTAVAGEGPLGIFTAATATTAGQELVGIARSDVDQVAAILIDGTQTELPLNQWRGFSYVASAPDRIAVTVEAYASGTPVGSVRVPQMTSASIAATTVASSQLVASRRTQAVATPPGYRISNPGRPVTAHGLRMFDGRFKYQLYLLGTIGGEAFYRVQVTPHYRCYAAGSAQKIGTVGMIGCPAVVGAYPLQLDDTIVGMTARAQKVPTYRRVGGLVADGAVKVDMRDSSGKTIASTPVSNNLFAFQPPYPKTYIRLVPVDAQGHDLTPHPQWGQHQQQPPFLFGPRATKVFPSRLQQPIQHGNRDGVDVIVGKNGVVLMKLEALSAQTRRQISGKTMGVSCFVVSPTIRHTRSAGTSLRAGGTEAAFKILGYVKPPFDGCEISGGYGHRWHDQWGTHSPIEVALTRRGQRYFDNRAAARDLALFVRSRDMHQLRKLHGPALIAAIRARYGNQVTILDSQTATAPANTVGLWTSGTHTVVSERSSTGGRFYVEIDNGKITKENVRGLAFVF